MTWKVATDAPNAPATLREALEHDAVVELRAYKRRKQIPSAEALARELGCSPDSAERYLAGKSAVPGWVVMYLRRAA